MNAGNVVSLPIMSMNMNMNESIICHPVYVNCNVVIAILHGNIRCRIKALCHLVRIITNVITGSSERVNAALKIPQQKRINFSFCRHKCRAPCANAHMSRFGNIVDQSIAYFVHAKSVICYFCVNACLAQYVKVKKSSR